MRDSDQDTTIGTGGWLLVALAGVMTFSVLRYFFHHDLFPAFAFGLAAALIVFLLLFRLAIAVTRYDDEEEANRVRKIVPATASNEGGARVSGVEGASAAAAMAVRVGSEPAQASPAPQRPSMVVTPLANVEPAPLIAPPAAKPPKPAAPKIETPKVEAPKPAVSKVDAPKVDAPRPAVPKVEKPPVEERPKAKTKPWSEKPPAKSKAEKPASKPATRPIGLVRLTGPRGGKADDLKEIEGIGPALEKLVNGMGIYHFEQIAAWTETDVAFVDAEMKNFKGRITRDRWVAQARIIVSDGLEAFRERAKTNDY
jgi:predicted flap endonuclease-1-like 5' DNA nuclease